MIEQVETTIKCFARSAPWGTASILGECCPGEFFDYAWQKSKDGWYLVNYKNQNGWIPGDCGKLVKHNARMA